MRTAKLTHAFLVATPLFLSGCMTAPVQQTNLNNCNSQDVSGAQIPLLLETSVTSNAVSNTLCKKGTMLGAAALIGRGADGTLHPASIITWYQKYTDLIAKLVSLKDDSPEVQSEKNQLAQTKNFADAYIQQESVRLGQGLVTSPIVYSMYHMKVTDPSIFKPDGSLLKESFCKGAGIFRKCVAPEPQEIAVPADEAGSAPTPETPAAPAP